MVRLENAFITSSEGDTDDGEVAAFADGDKDAADDGGNEGDDASLTSGRGRLWTLLGMKGV